MAWVYMSVGMILERSVGQWSDGHDEGCIKSSMDNEAGEGGSASEVHGKENDAIKFVF